MSKISKTVARQILEGIRLAPGKAKTFRVTFNKRSTGEVRVMVAKFAKKDAQGDRAYDFSEHGLTCVLDVEKDEYRTIPFENVTKLEVGGKVYEIR